MLGDVEVLLRYVMHDAGALAVGYVVGAQRLVRLAEPVACNKKARFLSYNYLKYYGHLYRDKTNSVYTRSYWKTISTSYVFQFVRLSRLSTKVYTFRCCAKPQLQSCCSFALRIVKVK